MASTPHQSKLQPGERFPDLDLPTTAAARGRCLRSQAEIRAPFTRRGRAFRVDARPFEGEPVAGAWAHVCALPEATARIPYDQPEGPAGST